MCLTVMFPKDRIDKIFYSKEVRTLEVDMHVEIREGLIGPSVSRREFGVPSPVCGIIL